MSEMNPQKVIAAFRLGFLTGLLLDESYEKGEFRRLYLWSVVGGLFDATLATLGNEVDPDSQRRWGRCLEAIDIVREEDLRGGRDGGWLEWGIVSMFDDPNFDLGFGSASVAADHARDALKSLARPGISESGPLWNWYTGGAALLGALSVDQDADRDKWGVRFDTRALHLLPSELLAGSQLLRDVRQLAHPFLSFEDLGSVLPGLQGQHFQDSLLFLGAVSRFRGKMKQNFQVLCRQFGEVFALLALSLALAAQLQESLGGGRGESWQQDEMAAVLKDIENSRDMSLVIEAVVREQDPASRKKIMQSIRSSAFGKGLVMIDATKMLLDDPDASVRCEACITMGWFGRDALDYVPDLMAVALKVKGEGKGKGKFKGKGKVEEKVEEA